MRPETRYASSDGLSIAYQVFGEGKTDLVLASPFISHLDLMWENTAQAPFVRRLGSFARVIAFDRRGVGLSDPAGGAPTLEQRMEDLRAVLDAAGSAVEFAEFGRRELKGVPGEWELYRVDAGG